MKGYNKMFQSYIKGFNKNQNKFNFQKNLNGKMEYIKTVNEHTQTINNLVALNDSKYLTSDNNEF